MPSLSIVFSVLCQLFVLTFHLCSVILGLT
nr:MAG TPA: hypothetical protein [Caudoviricetes sp.]